MTEEQSTQAPPQPTVPWTRTPFDVDVSPNPLNRDRFMRDLISHVELLTDRVRTLEEMAATEQVVVEVPTTTVEPEKPKPKQGKSAAKGGGGKK